MAILDESGAIMVHYIRQGYGLGYYIVPSNATGSMLNKLNPFGYRGYVRDRETYLYYLESRYYSEDLCRFLNSDALVTTGQGLLGNNMFAYCGNNPVMCSDEQGTATKSCLHDSTEPRTPWKNSGSGGGILRRSYRPPVDYGDAADKFYTVRFFRWLGDNLDIAIDAICLFTPLILAGIGKLAAKGLAFSVNPVVTTVVSIVSVVWDVISFIDKLFFD